MGSNRSHLEATYVDANTLKVANDWRDDFATWTRVELVFSNGTKKYAHVIGQSYSSPDTTIDISEDILDSTLTHVAPGLVSSGDEHGVPLHSHDDPESNEGHGGPIPYTCRRAIFERVDTDTVTIGPCRYYIQKETATLPFHKQVVWSNQDLTFDFSGLGASQIQYVYIDHSYVIANIKNGKLTAACFYNSTTAPTWSNSRHGWYNGDDLNIWHIPTNSSSQIREFVQVGNRIEFQNAGTNHDIANAYDLDTSWVDFLVAAGKPVRQIEAMIGVYDVGKEGGAIIYIRCKGATGDGRFIVQQYPGGTIMGSENSTWQNVNCIINIDSNQYFQAKLGVSDDHIVYAQLHSFYLGEGQ